MTASTRASVATVRLVSERQHEMPDLRRLHRVGAPQAHGLDAVERRSHKSREVQRIERDAQISQRAVEPQRDGHRAGADPETLRRNRKLLESVGLLDLELERRPVEVEREIVLIADEIVDRRHVVAPRFHAHAGPVQRLTRNDRGMTVAAREAAARHDRLEEDGSGHAARTFKIARWFRSIRHTSSV